MVKKKKGEEKVKTSSDSLFDKTIDLINKEEGEDIVQSLCTFKEKPIIGTSTGSLGLDSIICPDAGGMIKGQIIEFWGPWSGGKTTLALGLCANATANGEKVIYVDAEFALRANSMESAGVDEDLCKLIQHRDARKVANVLERLMLSGGVGVIVIDSVATWKPLPEGKKGNDEIDFTKQKIAFASSFLTLALPHLAGAALEQGTTLVLLNQARNDISSYSGGLKPFGGHSVSHGDSVRIRVTGNVNYKSSRIHDDEGNIIGQYSQCLADKNKIHRPMGDTDVPIYLGIGVNPYMELVKLSQKTGIVNGAAGRFKWADSDEPIAHGADAFAQTLFDDTDMYMDLRSKVIDSLGINYGGRVVVNAFHDEKGNKRNIKPNIKKVTVVNE